MPKFNLQDRYNKLPDLTKGVIDTIPTVYVVFFISFFLNLTAWQIAQAMLPFLVLTFFVELWKARYVMRSIYDAFSHGYEAGMENKENE